MNSTTAIILFIISLVAILSISRKNLWIAIIIGGIILSLASNPISVIRQAITKTIRPTILLLAIALAEVPLIGTILESDLLKLFNTLGTKKATILGPATFGLLPIPGGAVLSCPIVDHSLHEKTDEDKVAANIWFRHMLFLIYPLSSALIVSTTIARIDIIMVILYMLPLFIISIIVGVLYYLRDINGSMHDKDIEFNRKLLLPILLILLAPMIQIVLRVSGIDINVSTFIAVSIILLICVIYYRVRRKELYTQAKRMKIWNFSLILLSIIFYAEIFLLVSEFFIENIPINIIFLSTLIPFILGFLTGRVQLTTTLVIPIVLSKVEFMSFGLFIMIYTTALCGYLMSPAHPCLVLSSEYFKAKITDAIGRLLVPCILFALIGSIYGWMLHIYFC